MSHPVSHSDVLIVGAGSAGSVLAERLSADSGCTVTVVEAGPGLDDPVLRAMTDNGLQLPIGAASPLVARFQTTLTERPQRTAHLVRGATVGGSGAVNGGYFCRALPADFDSMGIPGWSWAEVLEHYRAVETDLDFDGPLHGDHGPIAVQRAHEMGGCTAEFVKATQQDGFDWLDDLNGVSQGGLPEGIGAVPLNIVDGVRRGAGAAFLLPALGRPNLRLVSQTRAWRVRISGGRAVGVDAVGPEGPLTLTADRIVISCGAIGSAHLLMLSGMGPESMLHEAGLAVVAALPVGARFADHPEWVLPTNWAVAARRPALEVVLSTDDRLELRPYTGGFVAMVGDGTPGHPDWPHIGVALMKPLARGRLTLLSADPSAPLRIEHRYDSEPADIAALTHGAELARELAAAATEVGDPAWSTSQHLCGTAPMGTEDDPDAVLDAQCRVRGVTGLWVIDGSALPAAPSRGPHATIVMLGHRATEFVLAG